MRTPVCRSFHAAGLLIALLAALPLVGCMSKPSSRVHYVGPAPDPAFAASHAPSDGRLRLATLGSGDALGRSIHQNDVYLAYLAQVSAPLRVTGVPDAP